MQTEAGLGINCVITDFCLDGMFVKFMGTNQNRSLELPGLQEKNGNVQLSFSGDKGQSLYIHAEIVHSMEGACGLRFLQRYDKAVQSLINVSARSGIAVQHTVPVQKIIEQCIQCIHQEFGALLHEFWPSLVAMLKSEAVKASQDQTANMLMALSEKIRQNSQNLESEVLHAIEDPVAAFNAHLEKRKAMSDKLSIIDKEEFEDWLLARVLIMKCEADYQSQLLPLKLRLDAISIGDKRHHQSVFGPALLVNAFQAGIHSLQVDGRTEKQIFRQFELTVMSKLDGLYQALNDILIKENILPKLDIKQGLLFKSVHPPQQRKQEKHERNNAQEEKLSVPASNSPADSTSFQPGVESSRLYSLPPFSADMDRAGTEGQASVGQSGFSQNHAHAQRALTNISHLLKRLRPEASVQAAPENQKPAYSADEFDQGLAGLQADNRGSIAIESTPSLMERVRERLKLTADKVINDQHKTAIDVVDRFFLSMRDNQRISDEAKQYLLRLDVPILKVLLKDEDFFENRQSSVRAVINRIAQLGAKGLKLHPASKAKIDELVNQIVTQFDQDTAVFDQALKELDKLLERQNHIYVKNVERVAAAAEGAFKVEEANIAVTDAINQRIADKFVPSAVITLLNEGWKEYLQLTHIKHGEDSTAWQEALSVLDRLIAFGDDPRIPIDIKVLLPKIQDGLKLVSGNNEASVNVRDALKAFILNAPKGMHLSEQAQKLNLQETEEDLLKRNITKSQSLKDWILKVKAIPMGSWFQFVRQDEQPSYIRLVWVAKGYSKFVFVNHQGMRVIELGLFKLADYFKGGAIKFDPDYEMPIVNQGLDDMVKDVYDKLAYESSHDASTGLIKKAEFCRQVRIRMKQGKRTSACSLLIVHFRKKAEPITLTDEFAKEVVQALNELPVQPTILGRISETDFVIFNIIDDTNRFRTMCQEALIALCNNSRYASEDMLVSLGESRAHLGFNNPESMIRYASEAIESASSALNEDGSEFVAQPERVSKQKSTADAKSRVLMANEAANTALDEQAFHDLEFDIYCQDVAAILQSSDAGQARVQASSIKQAAQLNLLCLIKGDSQAYYPETDSIAVAMDEWWLNTLKSLFDRDAQIFETYDAIRVSMSSSIFNSQARVEQLEELAQSGRLNASKCFFDIYDAYQIEDVELAAVRMNFLKQLGYRFCLEHFGTERCPFAYLKALPADMIKIDDSFVSALNYASSDEDQSALVKGDTSSVNEASADSIVEIAHYMGKQVLACAVDSAVCLQKMKHMNVDFVQGSTVSKWQKFEL